MFRLLWIVALAALPLTAAPGPDAAAEPPATAGCAVGADGSEQQACCRVCTNGKACGNSCIARTATCRQPQGCACNLGDPRTRGGSRETPQPAAATPAVPEGAQYVASARCARPAQAATTGGTCTVASITDGDTFTCDDGSRVRLLLIDAPERDQGPYGAKARAALSELLPPGSTATLELDVRQRDRFGRVLAYVTNAEGRFVNKEMLRRGMAIVSVHPPNVRHVDRFREAGEQARAANAGLWSGSAFDCAPADHRAGRCE
jgi:micrococcal nuclease